MPSTITQKVTDVFGRERLHAIPLAAMTAWRIPPTSRTFLAEVGLPDEPSLLVSCVWDAERLRWLSREFASKRGIAEQESLLRPFAREAHRYLCLDEQASTGRVLSVDPDPGGMPLVVTSSVELFALSLALYREACDRSHGSDDATMMETGIALHRELRRADPEAFSGEQSYSSWWALVWEQMKQGLI
jgi:hypothetical protein